MSAIDKLIAAMQRTQLEFQRLARSTPLRDDDASAQQAVANVLGDMIRLGAELRAAETVCAPWTCLGCEKQHCGRQYQDSSGSEPFCGPCLGLS